ncbi:MAG: hypothetical protein ACRDP3_13835 [Streptomyces sp.]|uniref:hypothetical protein n=1 Tax=Streptomyces sp. TaxID=1931 RepID=UPI003D6AC029
MVSWGELNDLRLGKLKDAVSEWGEMTAKLEKLADGGGEGTSAAALEKKAQAADWTGQNATVTREFVTKTAREFDDAVSQARSVRNLLRGVHSDFQSYKEKQETIRADAARKNLYIESTGAVKSSVPSPRVVGGGELLHKPTQKEADGIAADVKKLLHDAKTQTASRREACASWPRESTTSPILSTPASRTPTSIRHGPTPTPR